MHFKYKVNYKNYQSITSMELFDNWLEYCTGIEEDGKRYYLNKGIALKDYEIDEELLQDLKELFEDRLIKNRDKINKKLNSEKATDKQVAYANKLYKRLNGKVGAYKVDEYSKSDMAQIIDKLQSELNNQAPKEENKVIKLFE